MNFHFFSSLALAMVALVGGWGKCLEESDGRTPWYRRITTQGIIVAVLILLLTGLTLYFNAQDQERASKRQESLIKDVQRTEQLVLERDELDKTIDTLSHAIDKAADDAQQLSSFTKIDIDRKTRRLVAVDFPKHLKSLSDLSDLLNRILKKVKNAPQECAGAIGEYVKLSNGERRVFMTELGNVERPRTVVSLREIQHAIAELNSDAGMFQNPSAEDPKVLTILNRMQMANENLSFAIFSAITHYKWILSSARTQGHEYLAREFKRDAKTSGTNSTKRMESKRTTPTDVRPRVLRLVAEQLSATAEKLNDHTDIRKDLGADDLDIVNLIMAIEEEFDMIIPDLDAEKLETVGDIINYLAGAKD
jgi:acyl carrier protein